MVGQVVFNQDVDGVETFIRTDDFEPGIYFVTINNKATKKLIVN